MDEFRSLWLVVNAASGSNDEGTTAQLRQSCADAGLRIERVISFPDDALPTCEDLLAANIGLVAIFTGDGTVNALVTGLYGWDGAILILPGGTKNLLYHRLHAERDVDDVLHAVAGDRVRRTRPAIIRCEGGDALAGLMAGPATAWNDVREALRRADIPAMASGTARAIGQSVAAPTIVCADPPLGRREGYPLIELTPQDTGFAIDAYYSDTVEDYLAQGIALLKQDFREGPSERLGTVSHLHLRSASGEPIGLLIDGEPADCEIEAGFALVPCEVDLLATEFDA